MSDENRELGLQAITRMRLGLETAEEVIRDAQDLRWWLVWSTDAEPIGCQSFDTPDELSAKLGELRQFRPDVFIFRGRRLRMMTKPYLAMVDGETEIKLQDITREFADQLPPPDPVKNEKEPPAKTEPAYVPTTPPATPVE